MISSGEIRENVKRPQCAALSTDSDLTKCTQMNQIRKDVDANARNVIFQ